MSNWTFGRKIAFGFALSLFVLLIVGWVSYRSNDLLVENNRAVTHTHQVLEHLTHLLTLSIDAETAERGFLLTGDETFLQPYDDSIEPLKTTQKELRDLTADNPSQQQRLNELVPLIDKRMDGLRTAIASRRAGVTGAAFLPAIQSGKTMMDDIRRVVAEMDGEERRLLTERSTAAEQGAQAAKTTILGGIVLAVGIVLAAAWILTRSLTSQLTRAVTSIRSSSAELEAAATQQVTGSREQSSAATEVSTTLRELLSTSKQIAESSQRVARIAEQTATGARSGDSSVVRARDSITTIKSQVDVIVGHMLDLGRKSQQAGSILEIINELAEQTNILAINASIEAAGAGEAGKRFSVVAEEIRKLADRVGGSTKEIRSLVEDIRAAVNTTVMATESGAKAVDAGAKQFGDVTAAFTQIATLVGTTTEAAKEIELSTKQQATAVEQVTSAMTNVAQATKENETSSAQTLQTAGELATLSRDLMRLVEQPAV
ncbi:MAG TPA: CHASE3 domain-containing protein [Polyangiaceae bacterium]|jgi:methyl-accepting chemotaxis protein